MATAISEVVHNVMERQFCSTYYKKKENKDTHKKTHTKKQQQQQQQQQQQKIIQMERYKQVNKTYLYEKRNNYIADVFRYGEKNIIDTLTIIRTVSGPIRHCE